MLAAAQSATPLPVLSRVAQGDRDAMRECLARYGALVWSLARRHSPSAAEAEDAVQEILLDLWRSAGRYSPALASEAAFIAMLARRRLIDRRRQRARRGEMLSEAPPPPPPSQRAPEAERCAEASKAARALEQLRPEQRQVLLLATCQDLSHDEISKTTGMPLGTVKAHVRRGLMRVRAALLGVEVEEEEPR